MVQSSPDQVWAEMKAGNERFVQGTPQHPHQDAARRETLSQGQDPHAVVFCCSDSREAPEIVFDQGLGDIFTVRNAGQVATDSTLGSLEFAVGPLGVPLLIVLVHESCGAVGAAIDSQKADAEPLPPAIDRLVQKIVPSVTEVAQAQGVAAADADPAEAGRAHVRRTIASILERSEMISQGVADKTLGIIGGRYTLADGKVTVETSLGLQEQA